MWFLFGIKWVGNQIQNWIRSYDNNPGGMSGRKLSAFASIIIAAVITDKHSDQTNVLYLVIAWLVFALMCFRLIHASDIIDFKNGIKEEEKDAKSQQSEPNI